MALRDILVCLDVTAGGAGRLELALNLAEASKGHLTAVYTLPEPRDSAAPPAGVGLPPTVLGPVSPDGARAIGRLPVSAAAPVVQVLREAERADAVEELFRAALPLHGLDGEWHMVDHTHLAELIELTKATDLAILGQYPGDDSDGETWVRPDHVVTAAGRPVLVVPYAGTFSSVGKRVLVAWDGSREATRAVHDALPLIAAAEAVTVVSVAGRESGLERQHPLFDRIVRHLERHGLAVRREEDVQAGLRVCDLLLSLASDLKADLIVAGAYHHSQFREAVLGGVSRELLDHMTVPVLMSH